MTPLQTFCEDLLISQLHWRGNPGCGEWLFTDPHWGVLSRNTKEWIFGRDYIERHVVPYLKGEVLEFTSLGDFAETEWQSQRLKDACRWVFMSDKQAISNCVQTLAEDASDDGVYLWFGLFARLCMDLDQHPDRTPFYQEMLDDPASAIDCAMILADLCDDAGKTSVATMLRKEVEVCHCSGRFGEHAPFANAGEKEC